MIYNRQLFYSYYQLLVSIKTTNIKFQNYILIKNNITTIQKKYPKHEINTNKIFHICINLKNKTQITINYHS